MEKCVDGGFEQFCEDAVNAVRGYPNPMDFIDLTALGEDISDDWDGSCYHRLSDDSVISTSYGW